MPKDNQFWKEYNSQRREYNRLKQQEYRAKLKGKIADTVNLVADKRVADTKPNSQVADRKLWADYYLVPKPDCLGCQRQGILPNIYAFCSLDKDTSDPNFRQIYVCSVYHWTIYQGKGYGVE